MRNCNRLFIFLSTCLLFLCTTQLYAQENSPYSRYGLGDVYPSQPIPLRAMGGMTAAIDDWQIINSNNPASYGNIRSAANGGLVTFDVALSLDARNLKSVTPASQFNSTNLIPSYLQIAFPLNKKYWGMAFGLKPLTRINYSVEERTYKVFESGFADSLLSLYEGEGGLNQAFIGIGKRWKNLSFGANLNYYFGSKDISTKKIFLNDTVLYNSSNFATNASFNGIVFSGGLQYSLKLKERLNTVNKTREFTFLKIGVAGNVPQKINVSSDNLNQTFYYNTDGMLINIDTVSYKENADGKVKIPASYSIGLLLSHSINETSLTNWAIGAEYTATNWEKDYRYYDQTDKVINSWLMRFGGQFTPQLFNAKNIFKRTTYRIGFYTGKDYVNADGNELKTMAFTLGAGFPFRKFRSYDNQYTLLNWAFEFGKRGSKVNNITENFFRVSLGLSLSDLWFIKRRYD